MSGRITAFVKREDRRKGYEFIHLDYVQAPERTDRPIVPQDQYVPMRCWD